MVEGAENPKRVGDLQRGTAAHMREHLIGIRDMAEVGRFGTDQDARDALAKIILGCRCALK